VPGIDDAELPSEPQHAGPTSGAPLYLALPSGADLGTAEVLERRSPNPQDRQGGSRVGGRYGQGHGDRKGIGGIEVLLWSGPDEFILCDTQRAGDSRVGPMPIVKITLEDGSFRIDHLLPGTYTFLILDREERFAGSAGRSNSGRRRRGPLSADAHAGDDRREDPRKVAGRLSPAPLLHRVFAVDVEDGSAGSAFVGENGEFEIAGLRAGKHRLLLAENTRSSVPRLTAEYTVPVQPRAIANVELRLAK